MKLSDEISEFREKFPIGIEVGGALKRFTIGSIEDFIVKAVTDLTEQMIPEEIEIIERICTDVICLNPSGHCPDKGRFRFCGDNIVKNIAKTICQKVIDKRKEILG